MCKTTWCFIHLMAFTALAGTTCYIVLNETGKLDKVKRDCYNKMMDIKDDLRKKNEIINKDSFLESFVFY